MIQWLSLHNDVREYNMVTPTILNVKYGEKYSFLLCNVSEFHNASKYYIDKYIGVRVLSGSYIQKSNIYTSRTLPICDDKNGFWLLKGKITKILITKSKRNRSDPFGCTLYRCGTTKRTFSRNRSYIVYTCE